MTSSAGEEYHYRKRHVTLTLFATWAWRFGRYPVKAVGFPLKVVAGPKA
jgi:hypothetical protein